MPKPGALLPTGGIEMALPAVEVTTGIPSHAAFRIAVTTGGSLKAKYIDTDDSEVTLHYPNAGVFYEIGVFASVWKEVGSTIETVPVDTVLLLNG